MSGSPEYLTRAQSTAIGKRRRGRNLILLALLLALIGVFFGITLVKLASPEPHAPTAQTPP